MKKKIILLYILSLFIIYGCNSTPEYLDLLSTEEGKYALYIVGTEIDPNKLLLEFNNIDSINGIDNVDRWNKLYPSLKTNVTSFIFVFSSTGIVLKTDNFDNLSEFLKNN